MIDLKLVSINGDIYQFRTSSYAFSNPYNDEFEFIVSTHTIQKTGDINNSVLINEQSLTTTNSLLNGAASDATSGTNASTSYINLQSIDKTSQQQNVTSNYNSNASLMQTQNPTQDAYLYTTSNQTASATRTTTTTSSTSTPPSTMPILTQFNHHQRIPTTSNLQWPTSYYDASTAATIPTSNNTNKIVQSTSPITNHQQPIQQSNLISQQQYRTNTSLPPPPPQATLSQYTMPLHEQYATTNVNTSDWSTPAVGSNANNIHLNQDIAANWQHSKLII